MHYTDQLAVLKQYINQEFSASPSPFMRWLSPVILAADTGKLTFSYVVRDEMLNPSGVLHGGVTAAIMDDIIGATMFTLNEQHYYTTINNVIDYFAVAKKGETIIADTSIVRKGKQMANVQCEIWNEDRTKLLAKGSSNLLQINVKKPD
ncbi:uncharacterized domain 1-containing protein [Chitinophaga terrae (ex Kim and Jung 2007)]|uniref:Uncharacterized domain 1-containing protein n=1 Tax=Chitinophaga terrae (ex Kim and Jung 2007) TaxID=408074 RepID=A0A1H4GKK9_9BACT|nr:PaaI family thioesterase [Chitinophaga terrae (ex Kim and Jung 2007)]MDQ0110383.1 acyl-coenzyme A thioesterase 13 [Chitinophaga terrae (ex Kim and Jung 2007)]GEP93543.1 hypothetical protein CTE07_51880 [Chitinophaga terrae (ex Kim and Jung 2007)]SEB10136.1 uncharacterized domain 1-containing protein [Chitinophaga terrae (ex Kim and Jung 2007)]